MDNDNKKISCKDCSELLSISKMENVGKCLRDSMYKDPHNDNCAFLSKRDAIN